MSKRIWKRRRGWSRGVALGAVGLVSLLALGTRTERLWAWLESRTSPPVTAWETAEWAIEGARRAGAETWAPEILLSAEAAMIRARRAMRRQEVRFLPIRNFLPVADSLTVVAATATAARDSALSVRHRLRTAAVSAVSAGERQVSYAGEIIRLVPVEAARADLRIAEVHLTEAKHHLGADRLVEAAMAAAGAEETADGVVSAARTVAERFADPIRLETWRRWIEETVDDSRSKGGLAIVVIKDRRELQLYAGGRLEMTYPVELGPFSVYDKSRQHDRATPEGRYRVVTLKDLGQSSYHRGLALDYPNVYDLARFRRLQSAGGIPAGASIGGAIEIHGSGGRGYDWTDGCVALGDDDMDALFARVPVGTPVTIVPTDGSGPFAQVARRLRDGR